MNESFSLIPFKNKNFGKIRGLLINGEPWFVAADVCNVLEIKNPSDALVKLEDIEKMTLALTENLSGKRGGARRLKIISEPGLYRLVCSSRKPEAREIQHWVFHEVMPSIRKTGSYSIDAEEQKRNKLRDESIVGRRNLTDEVQRFNQRDFIDGDKNPKARSRYARLTAKTQTGVFKIPSGGRDEATGKELAALIFGETAITNAMSKAYNEGVPFAQAEQRAVAVAQHVARLISGDIPLL